MNETHSRGIGVAWDGQPDPEAASPWQQQQQPLQADWLGVLPQQTTNKNK
jgi:hypothetical protein